MLHSFQSLRMHPDAHIPLETEFVLGMKREQKRDKQYEIDMPNTNPSLVYPTRTIFHQLALGLALVPRWFVLGLQGVFNTNMLVNARIGGLDQHARPHRKLVRILVEYRPNGIVHYSFILYQIIIIISMLSTF